MKTITVLTNSYVTQVDDINTGNNFLHTYHYWMSQYKRHTPTTYYQRPSL